MQNVFMFNCLIVLLSSYVVCPIQPPGYNNSINLLTYLSQWSSTLPSCMYLGCFLENLSTTSNKSIMCIQWTCSIARAESLSCPIDARDQVCKRHNEICGPFGIQGVFRPPRHPQLRSCHNFNYHHHSKRYCTAFSIINEDIWCVSRHSDLPLVH